MVGGGIQRWYSRMMLVRYQCQRVSGIARTLPFAPFLQECFDSETTDDEGEEPSEVNNKKAYLMGLMPGGSIILLSTNQPTYNL